MHIDDSGKNVLPMYIDRAFGLPFKVSPNSRNLSLLHCHIRAKDGPLIHN